MTHRNLDDIWTILRNNYCNIQNDDVTCTICKMIMINARCGPCGCRYCFACISEYLDGNDKHCPGDTDDCKNEIIKLDINTFNDHAINRKISKMYVKCPEKDCQFKDELRNIESHMVMCNSRLVNCPYSNIGCKQSNVMNDDMKNHFLSEIVSHSKFLLKWNDNLKNDMEILKTDVIELRDENKSLKNEIKTIKLDGMENQMKILELETNENNYHNKIKEMNQEIIKLKKENRVLSDPEIKLISVRDWKEMKTPIATEMKTNLDNQTKEIEKMKQKWQQIENNQREIKKIVDDITERLDKFKNVSEDINKSMTMIKMESIMKQKVFKTFMWVIDKFSDKKKIANANQNSSIYSDAFYTHEGGYKLCLQLDFNVYSSGEGTPIFIGYCMMDGEFNDNLLWPCKFDVTFDLINSVNNAVHITQTVFYEANSIHPGRNKPVNQLNVGIGCILFKLEEFLNNPHFRKPDKILIKCTVKCDDY